MVYLRSLFVRTYIWTTITLVVMNLLSTEVGAGTMKIAYKKSIFGKSNTIKEKRFNTKPTLLRNMPNPGSTSTSMVPSAITNMSSSTKVGASMNASTTTNESPTPSTPATIELSPSTTPQATMMQVISPTAEDLSIEEPTTPPSPPPAPAIELDELIMAHHNMESFEAEASQHTQEIEKVFDDKILTEEDALRQYMVLNRLIEGATDATADSLPDIEPLANNTLEAEQVQEKILSEIITDADTDAEAHEGSKQTQLDEEEIEELFPLPEPEPLIAPRVLNVSGGKTSKSSTRKKSSATKATTTSTESNRPVPCTCGVFLTSQFKRGSNEQPKDAPVITNELDRTFSCNSVGQKQCQTKCLETIVQHLPNSANILCATLNRDCRKERAYLFIKNCRDHWVNTNLAAGREYCCRNGQPYNCPLV